MVLINIKPHNMCVGHSQLSEYPSKIYSTIVQSTGWFQVCYTTTNNYNNTTK